MSAHPALTITPATSNTELLILCDHATNIIPPTVNGGDLGLSVQDMSRHIAYDVGALELSQMLAQRTGAALIASRFSRLVIDPNRGDDDPTLVMKLYDGSIIPGNRHADAGEVAQRKSALYDPYHLAISRKIDAMLAGGQVPHLISIHSYTPQLQGKPFRPWHAGILWDRDDRLARPLVNRLSALPDIIVGDNEPYTGRLTGDTMFKHGTARGLPHVLIEIRNDLIETAAGQSEWADALAPILIDLILKETEQKDFAHG